ncbi:hypothetical protein VNO78_08188 [Psophocarpus tetragonolobus]|uniref:Uncharacterized protein n=1 Tax=Psophocarpus tetragonolobus TaxID=3891 RepID=A0AAN9SWR2_PSOTE
MEVVANKMGDQNRDEAKLNTALFLSMGLTGPCWKPHVITPAWRDNEASRGHFHPSVSSSSFHASFILESNLGQLSEHCCMHHASCMSMPPPLCSNLVKSPGSSNLPKTLFTLQHETQGIGLKRRAFAQPVPNRHGVKLSDMYNSEHKGDHHKCAPMSPRISFSNDFVDVQQAMKQEQRGSRSDAPVSSDFEFSVTNYSMMSADELFFKGRLLSKYKDNCNNHMMQQRATTTLKEELLINDDEYDHDFSLRPPKASSTRWKGLLGLKKSHIGSKKPHKSTEASSEARSAFVNEGPPINIPSSQELVNEGGSSCRDLEIGI